MKFLYYMERIQQLHKLISEEKTGTPGELSSRLSISSRRLYSLLDELKLMGMPIEYCHKRVSYYYTKPCELNFLFDLKVLSDEELKEISGGYSVPASFSSGIQELFW